MPNAGNLKLKQPLKKKQRKLKVLLLLTPLQGLLQLSEEKEKHSAASHSLAGSSAVKRGKGKAERLALYYST